MTQTRDSKSDKIIQIDADYRVIEEKRCFQLQVRTFIQDKKTGWEKEHWKFIGFYPNMAQVLRSAVDHAAKDVDYNIHTIERWSKTLDDIQEHFLSRTDSIFEQIKPGGSYEPDSR